ncbi:unnamed protein product, partial [Ectocarpus sp. 13 AM-2016]
GGRRTGGGGGRAKTKVREGQRIKRAGGKMRDYLIAAIGYIRRPFSMNQPVYDSRDRTQVDAKRMGERGVGKTTKHPFSVSRAQDKGNHDRGVCVHSASYVEHVGSLDVSCPR